MYPCERTARWDVGVVLATRGRKRASAVECGSCRLSVTVCDDDDQLLVECFDRGWMCLVEMIDYERKFLNVRVTDTSGRVRNAV